MNTLCRRFGLSRPLSSDHPETLRRELNRIADRGDPRDIAPVLAAFPLLPIRLPDAHQHAVVALAGIARRDPGAIAEALRRASTNSRPNATAETDERDDLLCRIERRLLASALAASGTETPAGRNAIVALLTVTQFTPYMGERGVWTLVAALDALSDVDPIPLPKETFVRALTHPAVVVRRHAAAGLAKHARKRRGAEPIPDLVAPLRDALSDPDATVRRDALTALEISGVAPLSPEESALRAVASGCAAAMIESGAAVQALIVDLLPPRRVGSVDDAAPALCQGLAALGDTDTLPALLAAIHAWAGRVTIDHHNGESFSTQAAIIVRALTNAVERLGANAPQETLASIADTPNASYMLYDSGGYRSLRPGHISLEMARSAARAALAGRAANG